MMMRAAIILLCILSTSLITFSNAAPPTTLTKISIKRIVAPKYQERAFCNTNKQCGRSKFCNSRKVCQTRLTDGSPCTVKSQRQCHSGICDVVTNQCSSNMLNTGTKCHNSDACTSGNCSKQKCRAKSVLGAQCQKDTNCQSGSCNTKTFKCIKANQAPIHPVVPWDHNLKNLKNLDPVATNALYYTDSGVFDISVANLFAAMHFKSKLPVVILSHSSWVGQLTCSNDNTIEIPFTSDAAYKRVSKLWSKVGQFIVVTHTDGCASTSNQEGRTFWLVKGLVFDDVHRTVDAKATQIAMQDAVGHITMRFGVNQGSSSSSTIAPSTSTSKIVSVSAPTDIRLASSMTASGTISSIDIATSSSTESVATVSSLTDGAEPATTTITSTIDMTTVHQGDTTTTPTAAPISTISDAVITTVADSITTTSASDTTTTVTTSSTSATLPNPTIVQGSCESDPTSCSSNSDRAMDDSMGYYDFDNDFSNSLQQFSPNLQSYSYEDYNNGLTNSNTRRDLTTSFSRIIRPVVKAITDIVAAEAKAFAADAPSTDSAIPQGIIVNNVAASYTPTMFGQIPLHWSPSSLPILDSAWGQQPYFFSFPSYSSDSTKSYNGADSSKYLALTQKNGAPYASNLDSGTINIFCVDCYIDGYFSYKGTLAFNLDDGVITQCSVIYTGKIDANIQIGLETNGQGTKSSRSTLANIALPGGFILKNVVSVGPAMVFETSIDTNFDAQADLLLGGTLQLPQFDAHLDMIDSTQSTFSSSDITYISNTTSVSGGVLSKTSFSIPMSLVLGLHIIPLEINKYVTLTMEPSTLSLAMTTSDIDTFASHGLDDCDNGMAWKTNSGVSFAQNTFDFDKVPLGSVNVANPSSSCVPLITPPTCTNNAGVKWAVFNNPFSEYPFFYGGRYDNEYFEFDPGYFNTATPEDSGITAYLGTAQGGGGDGTFYDSPNYVHNDHYALNHAGYFIPPMDACYTFTVNSVDDIFLFWMGTDGHVQNYNRDNADLIALYGYGGYGSTKLCLKKGDYIPFRIIFGDSGYGSQFYFDVGGPNGFNTETFYKSIFTQSCDGTTAPPLQIAGSGPATEDNQNLNDLDSDDQNSDAL